MRPAPGRPVPGSRFSSARVRARPANRPPLRPGERRPMHPTRAVAHGIASAGSRAGSSALRRAAPPSRAASGRTVTAARTALCSAWCEGRPDEGLHSAAAAVAFERAAADHAQHHHHRRHQREGPGREAWIRAKDLIARLLARGVFATVNQTLDAELATDMARHFGADTAVITFEEQSAKDVGEAADGSRKVLQPRA